MSSINSLISAGSNKEKETAPEKQNTGQLAEDTNYIQETSLSRKLEFEKGFPLSYGFVDNKIFTIPFTFRGYISFVGKKISEAPLNICMIFVCLYYLIAFLADMDNFGHLDLFFSISFHLFILVIEIFLSTIDYISIYINDYKVNNQIAHIYDN